MRNKKGGGNIIEKMWEKSIDKNREKESGGCWKVVLSKYLLYSIIYIV